MGCGDAVWSCGGGDDGDGDGGGNGEGFEGGRGKGRGRIVCGGSLMARGRESVGV